MTIPDPVIDNRLETIMQVLLAIETRWLGTLVHPARRKQMRNSTTLVTLATAAALGLLVAPAQPAFAQEAQSQAAYRDIEQTLGSVPSFFKQLPESAIAGAWAEMKAFQLSAKTQLNGKTKELIGLAVAAQIPCQYCIYFHTAAAKANGATEEEIRRRSCGIGVRCSTACRSTSMASSGRLTRSCAGPPRPRTPPVIRNSWMQ